jgi:hypothetical protein
MGLLNVKRRSDRAELDAVTGPDGSMYFVATYMTLSGCAGETKRLVADGWQAVQPVVSCNNQILVTWTKRG